VLLVDLVAFFYVLEEFFVLPGDLAPWAAELQDLQNLFDIAM
jgi:hypothetical protein